MECIFSSRSITHQIQTCDMWRHTQKCQWQWMHGCLHKTLHNPKRSTICRQCESWKEDRQVKWWLYLMDDYLPKAAQRNCNKFKPVWRGATAILPPWQAQTLPLHPLDQHSRPDIWTQLSPVQLGKLTEGQPTTRVNLIFCSFELFFAH